ISVLWLDQAICQSIFSAIVPSSDVSTITSIQHSTTTTTAGATATIDIATAAAAVAFPAPATVTVTVLGKPSAGSISNARTARRIDAIVRGNSVSGAGRLRMAAALVALPIAVAFTCPAVDVGCGAERWMGGGPGGDRSGSGICTALEELGLRRRHIEINTWAPQSSVAGQMSKRKSGTSGGGRAGGTRDLDRSICSRRRDAGDAFVPSRVRSPLPLAPCPLPVRFLLSHHARSHEARLRLRPRSCIRCIDRLRFRLLSAAALAQSVSPCFDTCLALVVSQYSDIFGTASDPANNHPYPAVQLRPALIRLPLVLVNIAIPASLQPANASDPRTDLRPPPGAGIPHRVLDGGWLPRGGRVHRLETPELPDAHTLLPPSPLLPKSRPLVHLSQFLATFNAPAVSVTAPATVAATPVTHTASNSTNTAEGTPSACFTSCTTITTATITPPPTVSTMTTAAVSVPPVAIASTVLGGTVTITNIPDGIGDVPGIVRIVTSSGRVGAFIAGSSESGAGRVRVAAGIAALPFAVAFAFL
ncbi:hypothetical protein BDK51DRAFT_51099, partial [Blyttiomyces helicus]